MDRFHFNGEDFHFHVWDTGTETLLTDTVGFYPSDAATVVLVRRADGRLLEHPLNAADMVLLRGTGLTAKNSQQEFFEGDVLTIQLPDESFWGCYEPNWDTRRVKTGVVRFVPDYGGFVVQWAYSQHQHHVRLGCDIAYLATYVGNNYLHELCPED